MDDVVFSYHGTYKRTSMALCTSSPGAAGEAQATVGRPAC